MQIDKIGICQWCVPAQGVQAVQLASSMGYHGMVLDLGKSEEGFPMSDRTLQQQFIQQAQESHIKLTTLAANVFCDHSVCNDSRNEKLIHQIDERLVQTADEMNIKLLQIPSFMQSSIHTRQQLKNTAENLKKICRIASKNNIIVGTENALTAKDNFILLDLVGEDNLKIIYDTANPYWFGRGLDGPEILEKVADYVCEVHVKDIKCGNDCNKMQFVAPGTGDVKVLESMQILKKMNFHGWIHNENEYAYEQLKTDSTIIKNLC